MFSCDPQGYTGPCRDKYITSHLSYEWQSEMDIYTADLPGHMLINAMVK